MVAVDRPGVLASAREVLVCQPCPPEELIDMQKKKIAMKKTKTEAEERQEKKTVTEEYQCTRFCRCCPFPGAKCCENDKPAH